MKRSRMAKAIALLAGLGLLLAGCVEGADYGAPAYVYGYPAYGSYGVVNLHHGFYHGHWDGHGDPGHYAHGGWGHGFAGHSGSGGHGGGHGGGGHR